MKVMSQAATALLLASAANVAWADGENDEVDAETTIRLMDAAEASLSVVVSGEIALPDTARIEPPDRGKSESVSGKDVGNKDRSDKEQRDQRDQRGRGDHGRSPADEAPDSARDMLDGAREKREGRSRSDEVAGVVS